jgi:DNA polymerase III subunit gamma/tau
MSSQWSIKYRPSRLSEVFGQETAVKELTSRAKSDTYPSAILFKGQFGTGKTTLAQIVAMNANCKSRDTQGNACGKCASCKSIVEEKFNRDTQVLDGSILGGKDDMSDFLENVEQPPLYDPRRILIIEESDQLSKSAINALHKVLEKPRPNLMFILLSMTASGVPPSIVSRCQTYNLKKVSLSQVMYYLKSILEKEGVWDDKAVPDEFKMQGIAKIAEACDGSLREAVQLLERAVLGKYYTLKELQENLNIQDETVSLGFLEDCLTFSSNAFQTIDGLDTTAVNEFVAFNSAVIAGITALTTSGYIKNAYFESRNRAIGKHPKFQEFLSAWEEVLRQSKPYIRKSELMIILSKYYSNNKRIPEGLNPIPEIRVRGSK